VIVNETLLSKLQSQRSKNGYNYESYIISKSNKMGFNVINITSDGTYSVQDPYSKHKFFLDGLFGNWFIEITTSISDGKMIKISETTRLIKKKFPKCKILVLTKKVKSPRKSDGYDSAYDYVKTRPHIDKVCVGEDEFFDFLDSIRNKITTLKVPNINNNVKPKQVIKDMDIKYHNLVRYCIDQQDLDYATKVVDLIGNEFSVKVTESTSQSSNETTIEKRRKRKQRFINSWKPFDSTKNLVNGSDVFGLQQPMTIVNRKEETFEEYVNSGIFYKNPDGTQNFLVDVDKLNLIKVNV